MSTKQEQLKAIFIEEAGEIIEKLDVDILRFEENPTDFALLNEVFRGVHTLKGNANAFGFSRLGGFVHHFEDVLDHYRSTKESIEVEILELIVNSVDLIKETMTCELDALPTLPAAYESNLEAIKALIAFKKGKPVEPTATTTAPAVLGDLASEFGLGCTDQYEQLLTQAATLMATTQEGDERIWRIDLTLDSDSYRRGVDCFVFIALLGEKAKGIESVFDCEKIPALETFVCDQNFMQHIGIVVLTAQSRVEIEENFEFLEAHEYRITPIDAAPKVETQAVAVAQAPVEATTAVASSAKSTIRIDTNKLDELFDSVGELVIAQNFIAQNEKIHAIADESIGRTIETLSKITKRIQDRVMSLRMVAIRDTFDKMKRVVRDTSKKTGKALHLNVLGEETEIDKTMIDSLSDPLIHIIRNAIDHGLEADSAARIAAGKSVEGTITLRAFHKSGSIVISVSDDGRGINKAKVLQKAIAKGIVTADENLTDSQIFALIMQPGFSTADAISDLSGRGVGLDVVKTSIEKLRGKIEIESVEGQGTTFSMVLPLTLAIIDGMLVQAAGEIYIIPTLSVVESLRPEREIVHAFQEKGEFISLRGQHLPIVRLGAYFGHEERRIEPWEGILVCVETEMGRIALMVDELVGRQQVVIKPLGKALARQREISGGAILGSGDIALILNIDALSPHAIEMSHA
ncbi:MAG: chemotaxis protein CheA [Sulfuricurvum sp. PC08-66]|nr:MAG: chemotaxis protein CheA [Sulfuricurvum sp. PC08-66]